MKKTNLLAALLLCMAGLQTTSAQKVVLHKTNNQTIECYISELDSITFVEAEPIIEDSHEWVDLGLPSGTLWATCNVGANKPEDYGGYFAWGETETKDSYEWSNYKWCNGTNNTLTKYCCSSSDGMVDNKSELEPDDDVATQRWGDDWQMPSLTQYNELINSENTTASWTTFNGVDGRLIVSNLNGNSIFLPAAGVMNGSELSMNGWEGCYWTRTLDMNTSQQGDGLFFLITGKFKMGCDRRCYGQSVRPVRKQ